MKPSTNCRASIKEIVKTMLSLVPAKNKGKKVINWLALRATEEAAELTKELIHLGYRPDKLCITALQEELADVELRILMLKEALTQLEKPLDEAAIEKRILEKTKKYEKYLEEGKTLV
jgi:NTP pyrophosphatase (non-canonical NTP hydrolase)